MNKTLSNLTDEDIIEATRLVQWYQTETIYVDDELATTVAEDVLYSISSGDPDQADQLSQTTLAQVIHLIDVVVRMMKEQALES